MDAGRNWPNCIDWEMHSKKTQLSICNITTGFVSTDLPAYSFTSDVLVVSCPAGVSMGWVGFRTQTWGTLVVLTNCVSYHVIQHFTARNHISCYAPSRAVFVKFPQGESQFWVLTSRPGLNELRCWHVLLYTVTVLEFASGRVNRGVKIDLLNLFTNISNMFTNTSRGSDILGMGVRPPNSPNNYSPAPSHIVSYRRVQSCQKDTYIWWQR